MKAAGKKFFVFLIIITLLLSFAIASPYIIVYSLPSIVREFYQRDLTIGKFRYNPLKATFRVENVVLKDGEKTLLSLNNLFLDISIRKTLMLQPTITSIRLDGLSTFIVQYSSFDFRLPEFFNITKKNKQEQPQHSSGLDILSKIKFSVNDIALTDINLDLVNMTVYPAKNSNLLSNVNFILPGVTNVGNKKITPRVSGKIFNKPFNILGHSLFEKDSLINEFNIKLDGFDIKDVAYIIPEIFRVKLATGIVSGNVMIKFITHRHSKPELRLSASARVRNVVAYDMKLNKVLVERLCGSFNIPEYDIFNNNLVFSDINVTSGFGYITLSADSTNRSCIFTKSGGNVHFKFSLGRLDLKNSTIVINDFDRHQKINMYFNNLRVTDIYSFKNNDWTLAGDFSVKNICKKLTFAGTYNISNNAINISKISVGEVYPKRLEFVKNLLGDNFDFLLSEYSGRVSYVDKVLALNGSLAVKNVKFSNRDMSFDVPSLVTPNVTFRLGGNGASNLSLVGLNVSDGKLSSNDGTNVSGVNFNLTAKDMSFEKKAKLISVKLSDDINLTNFSGLYKHDDVLISCGVEMLSVDKSVNCKIGNGFEVGGNISLTNAVFKTPIKVIASVSQAKANAKYESLTKSLNIESVEVRRLKGVLDIDKSGKLLLLSVIPLEFKSSNSTFRVNLDYADIKDSIVSFTDFSLVRSFNMEISQISMTLKNFPSSVYPQGELNVSGVINGRNPLQIYSKIGQTLIDGNISTHDLALSQLGPYFERYLGYKVSQGSLDLNGTFSVKNNKLDSKFGLTIKDLGLIKSKSLFPADLTKLIRLVEDNNGVIKLNIPVKGEYNNPNVDFRKIFFDLFYDMLDTSQSRFSTVSSNGTFIADNTYELLYFNAGTQNFTMMPAKFLSDTFKRTATDKSKYYKIQAFVDKQADSHILLQNKLDKMIFDIHGSQPPVNSRDERECLVKICRRLFGTEPAETQSTQTIRQNVLSKMTLDQTDYQALSYSRILAIKNVLVEQFRIEPSHILIEEKHILDNPYITGIGNNIGVVISGKLQ